MGSLGIASGRAFERPGISSAGAVGLWGLRDLELWSSLEKPNQYRYRSLSVGLWRAWGLRGQSPRCTQQSLYTRCLAVGFFVFGVHASAKPLPTMNRRRRRRRCRRRRRRQCITPAGVKKRKYAHTGSFAALIRQSQICGSVLLHRDRPP